MNSEDYMDIIREEANVKNFALILGKDENGIEIKLVSSKDGIFLMHGNMRKPVKNKERVMKIFNLFFSEKDSTHP